MAHAPVSADPSEHRNPTIEVPEEPAASKKSHARGLTSLLLFSIALFLLKVKGVLLLVSAKFKPLMVNPFEGFGVTQLAVAGGSMIVSLVAYAVKLGFGFALGFIIVLVLHEIGHALMIRAKGLRTGAMVFIPFIGGAVTLKRQPRSAFVDAQIGLAGPIAGTIASLVASGIFRITEDPLYLMIAFAGFSINLFNLTPIGPLDGGRIAAAITKWMWVLGGLILLRLMFIWQNPGMILLVVLSVFQIYRAIHHERLKRFYNISMAQRAGIAFLYFGLVSYLAYETARTYRLIQLLQAQ